MDRQLGIGWDIGIKNLAYCVIEPVLIENQDTMQDNNIINEYIYINNSYYKINFWRDINLVCHIEQNLHDIGQVTQLNNTLKCCENKKKLKSDKSKKSKSSKSSNEIEISEEKCVYTAVYCDEVINPDGTYKGYCKVHYKKLGDVKMPQISAKTCYYTNCLDKTTHVLKAHIYTGYCKKHITEMITTNNKQSQDFLKINRVKTATKLDINHLGIALFQELDKIKQNILTPNIVLLENQPVLKNPTMKSMQMFLFSYYLIRNIETSTITANSINNIDSINNTDLNSNTVSNTIFNKKIQCYSASKKIDLIKLFSPEAQIQIQSVIEQVQKKEKKTKKMAILMVEYLLKNNSKWLSFFNNHPKKDDLSDSLLMILHYFEKHNLEKINKDNLKETNKIKRQNAKNSKTKSVIVDV